MDRDSDLRLRHPVEADEAALVAAVDAWWGERSTPARPPRWWLRHLGSTSLVVEDAGGGIAAFLLGFHSPDRADEAVLLSLAVHPGRRRRGVGRSLVEEFAAVALAAGRDRLSAVLWPGNPVALRFLEALDFRAEDGPGTQRLYGVPAWPDFDGPGEDRAVMVRRG